VADNITLALRWVEAWNGGRRESLEEVVSPDFELHGPFSAVYGEPYRGAAGFRRWRADIEEQFVEWQLHVEPRELSGDCVLLAGHAHVRGRESGVELDPSAVALVDLRGDHVVRVRIFMSEADALEAFASAE
jgi:ketosteroid isomerase-like protein